MTFHKFKIAGEKFVNLEMQNFYLQTKASEIELKLLKIEYHVLAIGQFKNHADNNGWVDCLKFAFFVQE